MIPSFADGRNVPLVFVVGAALAGTNLLFQALKPHPLFLSLNEPRALWLPRFPALDFESDAGGVPVRV